MARGALALTLLVAALSLTAGARVLDEHSWTGRTLLDIDVGTQSESFSLSAFGNGNTPGGNCYIQGYPGSRADSTNAGPLTVSVIAGNSLTIGFSRSTDTYFANYNYSGFVSATTLDQNQTYGLISVTFKPTEAGQYVNIFSGLVENNKPITLPECFVNVTIKAVSPPSPPPPPSPTPPPSGQCSGAVPCYCQNGYCFNNGATLSTTCAPPGGQSCTPVTINPSQIGVQYSFGYPSSVNVCKCTPTAG